jgi:hypothetical protein
VKWFGKEHKEGWREGKKRKKIKTEVEWTQAPSQAKIPDHRNLTFSTTGSDKVCPMIYSKSRLSLGWVQWTSFSYTQPGTEFVITALGKGSDQRKARK